MDTAFLILQHPRQIEGEPAEVAEQAKAQLREAAPVVAQLVTATFTQLRAAGIDVESETPESDWLRSPEGKTCEDLLWAAKALVEAARRL